MYSAEYHRAAAPVIFRFFILCGGWKLVKMLMGGYIYNRYLFYIDIYFILLHKRLLLNKYLK